MKWAKQIACASALLVALCGSATSHAGEGIIQGNLTISSNLTVQGTIERNSDWVPRGTTGWEKSNPNSNAVLNVGQLDQRYGQTWHDTAFTHPEFVSNGVPYYTIVPDDVRNDLIRIPDYAAGGLSIEDILGWVEADVQIPSGTKVFKWMAGPAIWSVFTWSTFPTNGWVGSTNTQFYPGDIVYVSNGGTNRFQLHLDNLLSLTNANMSLDGQWLSSDGDDEGIFIATTGNVGIGTDSPTEALEVVGTVTATAFVGDLSGCTGISTSVQGELADSAVQPTDTAYTNTAALAAGAVQRSGVTYDLHFGSSTVDAKALHIDNSAGSGSYGGFPSLLNLQAQDSSSWVMSFGSTGWGASYVKGWYLESNGDLKMATYGATITDPQMNFKGNGDVEVGANLSIAGTITGQSIVAAGGITANAFTGDGSGLTGIDTTPPVSNTTTEVFTRSVSIGVGNTISGDALAGGRSLVHGYECEISGSGSHAEGNMTYASGNGGSHAEGESTVASGDCGSHAEGIFTHASGYYGSHAEGVWTLASGDYGCHAEGLWTVASGDSSHASGVDAEALHDYSFVWSSGTRSIGDPWPSSSTSVVSTASHQFTVHAQNGIRLLGGNKVLIDGDLVITNGTLSVSGGAFGTGSDIPMGVYTNR